LKADNPRTPKRSPIPQRAREQAALSIATIGQRNSRGVQ